MDKKIKKYLKIGITIIIIALFVWFLILSPFITFRKNEKAMEDAAKRYYELNGSELPTGKRLATVSLQTLYHKGYIKGDLYIPNTKEPCSVKESWVKVKKENNEYKYYTYLKCGVITSNVDHKGPTITLNGDEEITINKGEKYEELGVKSIVDNKDGKMKTSEVTIDSSSVNINEVGTYEVTYTALDSLKNKTTVTRKVKVIEKIKNTVNNATKNKGYYTGNNSNNYLRLSGMMFRIIGVDGNNVRAVAEEDIANVNYEGIDDWLEYYYDNFTDEAKEYLVKNKYCNMNVSDNSSNVKKCTNYTKEKYVYVPSIVDVNLSLDENNFSFLKPQTMSWLSDTKDKNNAYVTRSYFYEEYYGYNYIPVNKEDNYGVRPVITIKGSSEIKSGDGTEENPYSFNETKSASEGQNLNERIVGEYLQYSGILWRIVNTEEDGTTKVIAMETLKNSDGEKITSNYLDKTIYNPKSGGNVGYYINNTATKYIDTSYFVNHIIEVPIYKDKIKYGEETTTKKYKVKLSAPNMYEMFSAGLINNESANSFWLLNSSKTQNVVAALTEIGVPLNVTIPDYQSNGIRVVGYMNKNVVVTSGKGTEYNPYIVKK